MSKRKIAECINVRINLGNYQHIELTKYAEEEIEFSSQEERVKAEDALRDDLVESIKRSMRAIPESLGKGLENAIKVEESIQKHLPEWMEKNPVPNIANANGAQSFSLKKAAEQKDAKDTAGEVDGVTDSVSKSKVEADSKKEIKEIKVAPIAPIAPTVQESIKPEDDDVSDLFVEDEVDSKSKVESKTEELKQEKAAVDSDGFDIFDDDDLFGD